MMNIKRILSILFVLALSFALVSALTSCDASDIEGIVNDTYHTVTFDSDGGTDVESVSVLNGKKVSAPTAPEKVGYTFLGWYIGDEEWSFIGYVVTEDMTLMAKWEEVNEPIADKATVTFDSDGGTAVAPIEVAKGAKAAEPTAPEKVGCTFLGWYIGDEEWSFIGYIVTEDMTLMAKWETIEYELTVNDNVNGNDKIAFNVESGTFTVPTPMSTATKRFIGWRVGESEELVSEFAVEKGTAGDITITAVYKDICLYHVDADNNGVCDMCDEPMNSEGCEHDDVNGDDYCDICGIGDIGPIPMKPLWGSASIIMQLNKCSNNAELSSELARYIAGESMVNEAIDKAVAKRNILATDETKVSVYYRYWDDDSTKNKWGATIDHIEGLVTSTTLKDAPDVYSTYIYDLVGSSVKGYFANLKGTSRGSGKLKGLNYFEFVYDKYNYEKEYKQSVENDRGFMYEWMESVTLDPANRMYVLASDYYIDMVRAMTMIPVNKSILEEIANKNINLTGDRNGDDEIDIKDFYEQVRAGEWTFDLMMEYSKAAYIEDNDTVTLGKWLGDTRVGFAMSDGGVANTGIIYSSPIKVIHKAWNTAKNDYDYYYPGSNKDPRGTEEGLAEFANGFCKLVDAVEQLLATDGVVYVKREYCQGKTWNDISMFSTNTEHQAIRAAFGQGSVLFGDIMMVGALEEYEYQRMRGGSFGVLPVPVYHDNIDEDGNVIDKYLTQIHSVGRAGAIAYNTKKFVECTAFLNYQSTNSTKILNDYYTYNLCYTTAGGDPDTVEMLEYLRDNVRTSFDKVMEDAMGIFVPEAGDYRMTYLLPMNDFVNPSLEIDYASCVDMKQSYLDTLTDFFKGAKQ